MITSQYRRETGSNDINPHKRLISLSPLLRSQISKTKTVVEFSNQVYGLISLQQSPVLKGIIRFDIKYYLIILI